MTLTHTPRSDSHRLGNEIGFHERVDVLSDWRKRPPPIEEASWAVRWRGLQKLKSTPALPGGRSVWKTPDRSGKPSNVASSPPQSACQCTAPEYWRLPPPLSHLLTLVWTCAFCHTWTPSGLSPGTPEKKNLKLMTEFQDHSEERKWRFVSFLFCFPGWTLK